MTIEEQLAYHKARLKEFEETLKLMPADTVIGRLCLISYIKRERRAIDKLTKEVR